jgi:hypothetical protein
MACFSMSLIILQTCHLAIFPAPLIHLLFAAYLAVCHLFYRLHFFVLNASQEQLTGQMSAAQQLFNVLIGIGMLTVTFVFKD